MPGLWARFLRVPEGLRGGAGWSLAPGREDGAGGWGCPGPSASLAASGRGGGHQRLPKALPAGSWNCVFSGVQIKRFSDVDALPARSGAAALAQSRAGGGGLSRDSAPRSPDQGSSGPGSPRQVTRGSRKGQRHMSRLLRSGPAWEAESPLAGGGWLQAAEGPCRQGSGAPVSEVLRGGGGGGGLRSPLGSPPLLPPPQHPPWGWHRLQSREHGGAEEDPGASQGQPEAGPHCVFSATRPSF